MVITSEYMKEIQDTITKLHMWPCVQGFTAVSILFPRLSFEEPRMVSSL